MEKFINEFGKECYKDVESSTPFADLEFHEVRPGFEENEQFALHTNLGTLTILDRVTGYGYGIRDIETGFRSPENKFWLASGGVDVRDSGCLTIQEAIDWVKSRSNTCVGE